MEEYGEESGMVSSERKEEHRPRGIFSGRREVEEEQSKSKLSLEKSVLFASFCGIFVIFSNVGIFNVFASDAMLRQ